MQAIFVRKVMGYGQIGASLLATDIPSRREAVGIVARLAAAHPSHGVYAGSDIHWFCAGDGMTEIWAQPI